RGRGGAVRARPVRVVRPVRPQDPDRRRRVSRRRRARRARLLRGAAVRVDLRPQRARRGRARFQPAPAGDAVPQAHLRARVVGGRARARERMTAKRARIFTLPFTLVVASGLCYFTALAMLTPVLPDYVEKSLGSGSIAVGIAVGAFAVGAILLRPFAGRIGDTVGRK